ncbi:E3 ubiquitin-protein ligase MARCHF5 [Schistocerca cancellata]|uniref:E3 ubiquitin-protein ligase MARCHF5 n=1 Tax=Schistocerca cancellata TaxID=274614 RepID=UPI002119176B|nr:E3 ubiquitin-protein ligase MARCHF5 [Schistocerca cancellata]XP_049777650.1 E3 ubiquitin-protein ligase MARCHF5 [Schistocerca cancellata]XP_049777651.1 E3 ubiquitin-protein ligase MARCHF5 [Schistocerca cancellata]XP_049777652.1 E3 ubiquitin-protein ligase MARCHF5 [Schistocerca cancellata]XP_049777654.1 E3 ubiquitin-protein ligase MARCHF5 [Schistocerca cancellata]
MAGREREESSNQLVGATSRLDEERRTCWVCFATDDDDSEAEWVHPCNCRGTTKWVHQSCIQRWVDEKQKGNPSGRVTCPQCGTEYIILIPNVGTVVFILDTLDSIVIKVCPFMAAGIVVGSIYWTAVTYGAVTIMQVVGQDEGMSVMEKADPFVLLFGLPMIPMVLIVGKTLHWEDAVLNFLRRHSYKLPLLKYILPSGPSEGTRSSVEFPPMNDPVSATRVLCGALLLPTVASLVGNIFFETVESNIHRTLLGGLAFVAVKGVLRIYHKQKQYVRQTRRRILDYTEANRNAVRREAGAANH